MGNKADNTVPCERTIEGGRLMEYAASVHGENATSRIDDRANFAPYFPAELTRISSFDANSAEILQVV